MNTKAKPTAGPCKIEWSDGFGPSADIYGGNKSEKFIAQVGRDDRPEVSPGESDANAELIADAFNVYHETGLTPRELKERIDTLMALITRVVLPDGGRDYTDAKEELAQIVQSARSTSKDKPNG